MPNTAERSQKYFNWLWLVASVLIILGFFSPNLIQKLNFYCTFEDSDPSECGVSLLFLIAHFTPLISLILINFPSEPSIRKVFRRALLVICLVIFIIFNPIFILPFSALIGPAAPYIFMHGCTIWLLNTVSVIYSFRFKEGTNPKSGPISWTAMVLALVSSLISLGQAPYVFLKARQIADGSPYCIARHDVNGDPLVWLGELRSSQFYTMRQKYYFGPSRWYFHGVLIVAGERKTSYLNWSYLQYRFTEIPGRTVSFKKVAYSCNPVKDQFRPFG